MLQGREDLNQTLYWALVRSEIAEAPPLLLLALEMRWHKIPKPREAWKSTGNIYTQSELTNISMYHMGTILLPEPTFYFIILLYFFLEYKGWTQDLAHT